MRKLPSNWFLTGTTFALVPQIRAAQVKAMAAGSTLAQAQNPNAKLAQYFLALLNRPANAPQLSKEAGGKLQEEHMAICSYNDHVRLPFSEPFGWFCHQQSLLALGANIVMESITLGDLGRARRACPVS